MIKSHARAPMQTPQLCEMKEKHTLQYYYVLLLLLREAQRYLLVVIVTELAERVHHSDAGVGDAEQTQSKRYCASHVHFSVLQHVVESPQRHVGGQLVAHGEHGQAKHGHSLVLINLGVFLQVLTAHGQQLLDLQYVASSGVRTSFYCPNTIRKS